MVGAFIQFTNATGLDNPPTRCRVPRPAQGVDPPLASGDTVRVQWAERWGKQTLPSPCMATYLLS